MRRFLATTRLLVVPSGLLVSSSRHAARSGELRSGALRSGASVQTPGGFARGGTVFRGLQPSEARLRRAKLRPSRRAKRGSTERSEAPPRLRRAKRGRAKVIGRSPLQKNSKRFHQKAQGNHLFKNSAWVPASRKFFFFFFSHSGNFFFFFFSHSGTVFMFCFVVGYLVMKAKSWASHFQVIRPSFRAWPGVGSQSALFFLKKRFSCSLGPNRPPSGLFFPK